MYCHSGLQGPPATRQRAPAPPLSCAAGRRRKRPAFQTSLIIVDCVLGGTRYLFVNRQETVGYNTAHIGTERDAGEASPSFGV